MLIAKPQSISVDRIFLDLHNPRHKPYESEEEVISYLCRNEYVFALAKDMAGVGLNPLEMFALLPLDEKKTRGNSRRYVVAEGNRRLCAIKLLNDPELAPANLRRDFRKLSELVEPLENVLGVVFEEADQVDPWLDRIHGGLQGGIGRKPWNAEQKTRHTGNRKNIFAQRVLDYATQRSFITAEERVGKLTTAQRYLGNTFVQEAIGLEMVGVEDLCRNRPEEDVDLLIKQFANDLVKNSVHSRANAQAIRDYSRHLGAIEGISTVRLSPVSLNAPITKSNRRNPKEPTKPRSIRFDSLIQTELERVDNYKLQKIYFSICDLPLEKHTPLISVGVWAFFEVLTARCGREPSVSFPSFLGKNKLATMGFSDKDKARPLTEALSRLSSYGNTTKHHDKSGNFNGEQLANDVDSLREVILGLLSEIK